MLVHSFMVSKKEGKRRGGEGEKERERRKRADKKNGMKESYE